MKKIVDYVLRRHGQADGLALGHVQGIDFSLARFVLDFPHPLLADRVDLQGIGRRPLEPEEDIGPEQKDKKRQKEGNDGPRQFEGEIAVILLGLFVFRTAAVLDGEDDYHAEDDQAEEHSQGQQECVQGIYLPGNGGGLGGKKWKVGHAVQGSELVELRVMQVVAAIPLDHSEDKGHESEHSNQPTDAQGIADIETVFASHWVVAIAEQK